MTAPVAPIKKLSERVTALEQQKVTYRRATVVAVSKLLSTFDAQVAGADRLNGIPTEPAFMPAIGDSVLLALSGAVPIYQPGRVGEGTIGEDELAVDVVTNITTALDTANGKNTVSYSVVDPVGGGATVGDIWFKRVAATGVIIASWQWDGTIWKPTTFGDQVLSSLTVGKLVGGTGTFDLIVGGRLTTANTGQRTELNPLGLQGYNASNTLTVNIDGVDNLLTGRLKTGLTGRRVEVGVTGSSGEIRFYAANGTTQSFLRSYTDAGTSQEGLQLGMPISGAPATWNAMYYNAQEWSSYQTKIHDFVYQDRWSITATSDRGVSGKLRMYLDVNGFQLRGGYLTDQSRTLLYDFLSGQVKNTHGNGGYVTIGDGSSAQSPAITLVQPDGIGVILRTQSQNTLAGFFDVKNGFDNGWNTIRAAAFTPTSDRATKEDIADATIVDPLAQVRTIRPRKFRRKHSGDRPVLDDKGEMVAVVEEPGPVETGVIAQELPTLLTQHSAGEDAMSFDITAWLVLLTAAIQELDKKGRP